MRRAKRDGEENACPDEAHRYSLLASAWLGCRRLNAPISGKFFDDWCRQTVRELILNYFRAQKLLFSRVVEDLNNKANVTMRKPYCLPHSSLPRTSAPSLTWQITEVGIDPRVLLTNQRDWPRIHTDKHGYNPSDRSVFICVNPWLNSVLSA
jgi:hypothetical protein